ncbi:enoyl-CoA hydratase/isomerase family protein [Microbacterium sp. CFBP9023]|uniref:enoyl-CoA hydratase/isomerase family protein n=1 Tax=unclassified Microbacterium TaxID=2609290 RepID=UPI0006F3738F|nr:MULTISPECIES: enoyl-CoA hydratase/isomerase family protein [unclassified Microbacterium]KRD54453.1 enoyl-CoA hydratase [Microbacterium sp. Root280D1]MDY0985382.1 enoyl-CoA hydratase/isomerase family protein [Microbacterium sp. CFBP9023]CAH0228349.1 4-chlorobenzoyl coenzyme A dehalogenase-2 [Microbacterium sp. Bi98]
MNDAILFTVDEGLARLTLNRPARLNAFNSDLAHAWRDATAEATSRTDVKAILIDAAGPAFCAGGDVIEMATTMGSGDEITALAEVINAGIRSLTESAVPVVAAAHGTTAGGGLGILLSSDYAVVGSRSRLGSLYANIGLTPDLSVSAQLARAVGQRRALQLVLQDRLLTAAEAVEWGLVAEAVDGADSADEAGRVRARAEEIARFWLAGAAEAYGHAKRLVRSQPERTFAEQLSEEARSIGASLATPDAQARIAAFAAASARKG